MKRVNFKSKKFRAREFLILVSIVIFYLTIILIMNIRDGSIDDKRDYYNAQIEKDYVKTIYEFLKAPGKYSGKRRSFRYMRGDKLENITLDEFRQSMVNNNPIKINGNHTSNYRKYWWGHIRDEYPNSMYSSYQKFSKRIKNWDDQRASVNNILIEKREQLPERWHKKIGYITPLIIIISLAYILRVIIYLILLNYSIYTSNEN